MYSAFYKKGFTLIELLVVIAIVGLLASVVLVSLNNARGLARISRAISDQRQLILAVELYFDDMGFYPPDVNRGWDPGLARALPYNLDLGYDCSVNPADCPVCSTCPSDWIAQAQAKWRGPYIAAWPNVAPWGGKYDFNSWATPAVRYGCTVPAGIYLGSQRNYDDTNPIPADAEQKLLDQGLDADGCLNGEAEMILKRL